MDRICYLYHAFLQSDDQFTEKDEQAGLLMELFGLTFDEKPSEVRESYRRLYDADLLEQIRSVKGFVWEVMLRFLDRE